MKAHADKTRKNKSKPVAKDTSQVKEAGKGAMQFADKRPETVQKRKLQEKMHNSERVQQLMAIQGMANKTGGDQFKHDVIQRIATRNNLADLPVASDDAPVPVGNHIGSEAEGLQILRRLAVGDRSTFTDLEINAPGDYPIQSHEWGLGFDHDENSYVIVRGGPGAVNWGRFPQVNGISHSHPLPPPGGQLGEGAEGMTFLDLIEMSGMLPVDQVFRDYNSVLPSNTDLIANYTEGGIADEMLYTPYRINAAGRFSQDGGDRLISIRFGPTVAALNDLGDTMQAENTPIRYLYAPLTIFAAGDQIWEGHMQAGTDRQASAWLRTAGIPGEARSRANNGRIIDDHNRHINEEKQQIIGGDDRRVSYEESSDGQYYDDQYYEDDQFYSSASSNEGKLIGKSKKKKKGKKKKGCFITTACVEARGLADDCYELTTLRAFRDGYMEQTPRGPAMISEYYDIAPVIVAAIQKEEKAREILSGLYDRIIQSVHWIEAGENEKAMQNYIDIVKELKNKYT